MRQASLFEFKDDVEVLLDRYSDDGKLHICRTNAETAVADFGKLPSGRAYGNCVYGINRGKEDGPCIYTPCDSEYHYVPSMEQIGWRARDSAGLGKVMSFDGHVRDTLTIMSWWSSRYEGTARAYDVSDMRIEDDVLFIDTVDGRSFSALVGEDEDLVRRVDRVSGLHPECNPEHMILEGLRLGLPKEILLPLFNMPFDVCCFNGNFNNEAGAAVYAFWEAAGIVPHVFHGCPAPYIPDSLYPIHRVCSRCARYDTKTKACQCGLDTKDMFCMNVGFYGVGFVWNGKPYSKSKTKKGEWDDDEEVD